MHTFWPAAERGTFKLDWLDSRQTFSFGEFYDPRKMGWRSLRVINEDHIAAGGGFPPHPHRDMEIFSFLADGELEHRDSLGTTARIAPGRVQLMSAGTGIRHSEYNPSSKNPTHLLQIWLTPRAPGGDANYQELAYTPADTANRLKLLASPDGAEQSLFIRQDVCIYTGRLAAGQRLPLPLPPGQGGWLQLVSGALTLQGLAEEGTPSPSAASAKKGHPPTPLSLQPGDAVALENEPNLAALATAPSEFLWFTLG